MRYYAGIDIGGTSIKWIIVDNRGGIVSEGQRDSQGDVTQKAVSLARELVTQHPLIAGVGVICPGIVDEARGNIVYATNLTLAGVSLAALIQNACRRPTLLGHDGRAAGLAEAILGAGRGCSSFIMMPIGTGISAALMLNGHLWAGDTFCAGEVGHAPVFPHGEECRCGQRGCLEVYASAKGIARRYAQRSGSDIGARAIEEKLSSDPIAQDVWETAVTALAISLTHLVLALDPQQIIIGGGLSSAGETLLTPVRQHLTHLLRWREVPPIVQAQLEGAAGRWGAVIFGCKAAGYADYERWQV